MLVNFSLLTVLAGLTAAAPKYGKCEHATLCIDAINDCGVPYGTCYDTCSPQDSPTAPPCTTTATPAHSITGCPAHPPTSSCEPVTICEDLINKCGDMYGGPRPSWTKPPCSLDDYPPVTTQY
ncbi:hypothetical protein G7046_g68 [Stylonectria norvegica]|nr:hypothetical protein G7046_g68 [Stylonectria norvegica]